MLPETVYVRLLFRAEAAIAASVVAGAERAASTLCDGSKTGCAVRHGDTDITRRFTLRADARLRNLRRAPHEVAFDDLEQLVFVDRTPVQLVVDSNVIGNGR